MPAVADIFKEVDEDVRRDKYMVLWLRYRWLILGVTATLIVGTGAYTVWHDWQANQRLARGERFEAAVSLAERGGHDAAARAFAGFAEDAGAGYATLARLREAAARAAAGDGAGAVAIYDSIAETGAGIAAVGELVGVLAARTLLDDGLVAEAEKRLRPVAAVPGAWQHLARELLGVAALQAGRLDEARTAFATLAEEAGVPGGVKERAGELLAALGGR